MNRFLYQYHYNGGTYVFHIPADTRKEADERLKLISGAAFLGDQAVEIRAFPGVGLWVRLVVWWKNLRAN